MSGHVHIPCGSCGAVNRVIREKLDNSPRCAKCKTGIKLDAPFSVNSSQFDKVVKESDMPVLVDFWAPWCGPCRMMHPVLEEIARKWAGKVMVVKLNTDEAQDVAGRFGIQGIPTLIYLANGREIERKVGAVSAEAVDAMIGRAI